MTAIQSIAVWVFVMVRASGLVMTMPVFSGNQVPRSLKVALGVMMATLAAPLLPAMDVKTDSLWWLIQVIFIELTAGVVMGFVCRFAFFALDVTGTLIANDLGLTMATVLNPGTNASSPITATLLYWLGVVTFFGLDMHHWILAFFIRTYSVLPIGAAHGSEELMRNALAHTSWILSAGIQVAAPILPGHLGVLHARAGRASDECFFREHAGSGAGRTVCFCHEHAVHRRFHGQLHAPHPG